jgi:hypothetical protein
MRRAVQQRVPRAPRSLSAWLGQASGDRSSSRRRLAHAQLATHLCPTVRPLQGPYFCCPKLANDLLYGVLLARFSLAVLEGAQDLRWRDSFPAPT